MECTKGQRSIYHADVPQINLYVFIYTSGMLAIRLDVTVAEPDASGSEAKPSGSCECTKQLNKDASSMGTFRLHCEKHLTGRQPSKDLIRQSDTGLTTQLAFAE